MIDREQFKQILVSALTAAAVGATLVTEADAAAAQGPESTLAGGADNGSDGIFADEEYREIFRRFVEEDIEFRQFLEDFFEVVQPDPIPFPTFPTSPFPPFPDDPF